MKILGISFETHDNGVALMEDGRILFALNEERLSRKKADNGFPLLSIKKCLEYTNLSPDKIDVLAIAGFPKFKNWIYYANDTFSLIRHSKGRSLLSIQFAERDSRKTKTRLEAILINLLLSTGLPQFYLLYYTRFKKLLKCLEGFKGEIKFVDHHLAHLAGAYYTSEWKDCLGVVAEGSGWDYTFSITDIENGRFKRILSVPWPHSPGRFYRLITEILGFDPRKHGGKITGLAAYGNPENAYKKVSPLMAVNNDGLILSPMTYNLVTEYHLNGRRLPGYFSDFKREDLAAAFQCRLEECICELISKAVEKTGKRRVVFSGGVAANVKLNQYINQLPCVDGIYIFPAMSDAGLALGAALWISALECKKRGRFLKPQPWDNVYLGPSYTDREIKSVLAHNGVKYRRLSNIEYQIAHLLANGKLVAHFNGRMEYGPRALGNRSIFYKAQDQTINDWLNKRLDRTEFMPFAPVTLEEEAQKCYQSIKDTHHSAKFMTVCYMCTQYMQQNYPAVVHVDGTARPQFVSKQSCNFLYRILKEYQKLTGFGTIVNTSFNMHEEPIVCSPEDAVSAFKKGHLDYLVIGDFLVENHDKEV